MGCRWLSSLALHWTCWLACSFSASFSFRSGSSSTASICITSKRSRRNEVEILLVLGAPLLGCILLALFGARRFAAELNAGMSLATLIAASLLVLRVIRHGPMLAGHEQFFVDSFNVFLVALTAFVGFTTALFSRPYMRIEEHHGRLNPRHLRLYHSMYQLFMAAIFLALPYHQMGFLSGGSRRPHVATGFI